MTNLTVRTWVAWTADGPATSVLLVRVGEVAGQRVITEHVEVEGGELDVEESATGWGDGARPLRVHASAGPVQLRYEAEVDVADVAEGAEGAQGAEGTSASATVSSGAAVELPRLGELDLDLLPWTQPSRYCPSDVLVPTAEALFADVERTPALLEHVRGWVEANIAYVPGTSNVYTGAEETLLRRTGVCRDLAHLATAMLRALGVPARMVSAYALGLPLQDFHAVVEAHDGRAWRLLDATGLAPVDTMVRIVTGRDAAEIAWGTTDGPISLDDLEVDVRCT